MENGERGKDLTDAVKAGDDARHRFIRANLRLVVSVANRYPVPHGLDYLDLIQEGNIGLERAREETSTSEKGSSSPPTPWLGFRQSISRAIDQNLGSGPVAGSG